MKHEITRNHYETFDRIQAFGGKHGGCFAAVSRATELFTGTGVVVKEMEEKGAKKISGAAGF